LKLKFKDSDEPQEKNIICLYLWPYCVNGCSVYNFGTGKIDAKTFQVNFFQNNADLENRIDKNTLQLQDLIQNQTNLNLVTSGAI
jgi:hypothetical protein